MALLETLRVLGTSAQDHDMLETTPRNSNEHASDERLHMIAEIEDLQRENQSLIQELHIAQENAKVARRDQVIGEERLRRQNERLEEARKVSDIAVKEQSQVMLKLNELQKWTDCIDDGEAVEVMHRLFQRLEDWIKRHFNQASKASHPIGNTGGKEALSGHWNKSWPAIQAIQAAISEQLCHGIFCRYMVGFPDRSYESTFHSVDKEIQRSFPPHVWRHWHSSTSTAVANLAKEALDNTCDQIAYYIEALFASYASKVPQKGMQQFKDLLQECVEFKLRLERQGCEYGFSWSGQGTRFREEQMRSLTGLSPANAMVFKSVWPMLWKATSDNCIVVEKEVVQLIEEPDPEPITTPDLLTEFSSPFT